MKTLDQKMIHTIETRLLQILDTISKRGLVDYNERSQLSEREYNMYLQTTLAGTIDLVRLLIGEIND